MNSETPVESHTVPIVEPMDTSHANKVELPCNCVSQEVLKENPSSSSVCQCKLKVFGNLPNFGSIGFYKHFLVSTKKDAEQ